MLFSRQQQRIRTKSVLLASYRRHHHEWELWLQWEIAKPGALVALLTVAHMQGWITVPYALFLVAYFAYAMWIAFVSWNAWSAFWKLDKKRLALLESSDVKCDFGMVMTSRRAWIAAREGKTMRQILDGSSLE